MRSEININKKSRGAIRNISGQNEEFQGMKLQFHWDETPVSSHETLAHTGKNRPAFHNLFLLTLILLFLSPMGNVVMGQVDVSKQLDETIIGESEEIRYVIPNENYTIKLQRGGLLDNLNGYIRWYNESNASTHAGNTTNLSNGGSLTQYTNGFFWYGRSDAPEGAIVYNSTTINNNDPDIIVCEASSIQDYSAWNGNLSAGSTVTVRRRYIIKSASNRQEELQKAKTALENLGWNSDTPGNLSNVDAIKSAFFQTSEIHTPMMAGTSYRLEEVLENYVIEDNSGNLQYPNRVRWRIYNRNGTLHTNGGQVKFLREYTRNGSTYREEIEYDLTRGYVYLYEDSYSLGNNTVDGGLNPPNIIAYYHDYDRNNADERQIFYLTAEVAYGNTNHQGLATENTTTSEWYPVTFLTVYLEPNSEPTIATELANFRTDDYLEKNYEYLGGINFDGTDTSQPSSPNENYPSEAELTTLMPFAENPYYAYAAPHRYEDRRKSNQIGNRTYGNRFVGSGEYGLYKTLGVSGVSPISSDGHTAERAGNTYVLYSNWAMQTYDVTVHDRLYEKTEGAQNGYFLYVDAAEEAGTIASISLGKNALCPNTRIITTAWVCNLKTADPTVTNGSVNADIGFILKGVMNAKDGQDAREDILSTFYSGEIENNPPVANYTQEAKWQQVYFSFDYHSNIEYDDYVLVLTNNCRNTQGADFAIDQLSFYRSLPRIEVERLNDCDASTLKVQTDLSLLYTNVGWTENNPVDNMTQVMSDFSTRKYRYGLSNVDEDETSYLGNIYFAFMEGFNKNNESQTEGTESGQYHWVNINKHLTGENLDAARYSARAIVSTHEDVIPTDSLVAAHLETVLNLRAVLDFNKDVAAIANATDPDSEGNLTVTTTDGTFTIPQTIAKALTDITLTSITEQRVNDLSSKISTGWDMTEAEEIEYRQLIENLYAQLGIPRIRCAWMDKESGTGVIRLSTIDVNNTDLKCAGETIYHDDGTQTTASGEYHVMVFTAAEVAGTTQVDPHWRCALVSEFTVRGVVTINIDTNTEYKTALCVGSQHRIVATLDAYDDDNHPVDLDAEYIFDWYLGPLNSESEAYEEGDDTYTDEDITDVSGNELTVQDAIRRYRDANQDYMREIGIDDLEDWTDGDDNIKQALIRLIQEGKLQTGTPGGEEGFTMYVDEAEIVAMPYIPDPPQSNIHYCPDVTPVTFDFEKVEAPVLYPGYEDVPDDVKAETAYLRLGLRHISTEQGTVTMTVPIRTNVEMAENASAAYLGLGDDSAIITWLNPNTNNVEEIGTATSMRADKTDQGSLTFSLSSEAATYFQEGSVYDLRIPYVQYASDGSVLGNQCDGLAHLYIKIVPEYLTWQGNTDAQKNVWYNDDNWNQSTKLDLYFDGYETEPYMDANGEDVVTDAFAPLYFTKITIPDEKPELSLVASGSELGSDFPIQYDMAASNDDGNIVPYYINKVDQIYFKPNASMYRQDYLDYQKAWVEFESVPGTPYWMASPLKGIYAGDMYAPTNTGRQETPAFEDIHYNGIHEDGTDVNSRWNPAFYQKAWDKAITYANGDANNDGVPDEDANETTTVSAVKSNWSIEYNDVTVPYSLGKGFYSRVEYEPASGTANSSVMVRLPKADTNYKYEPATRALTDTGKENSDYGQLADGTEITIDLSKEDTGNTSEKVDGDGKHFLVGNPYMAYLNMSEFFETNTNVVENKYWTIDNGTVVVGTPDVDFESEQKTGYIAPMTAFFIEVKDNVADVDKKITFSTSMMAQKPEGTENVSTRSYTATNPQLTLTASSAKGKSRAAVVQSFDASNQYESDRDAVTLLDSELDAPTVYTVAGNYAAAVNAVHDCQNIPLGVYAKDNEEVELTVEGASQLTEPLYLYDAVTRSSTPIEGDSYTLNLTGSSHGRYFLTTDAGNIRVESDIRIYSPNGGQLIIAASPSDKLKQVQIYDLSGRMVESRKNIGASTYQLNVTKGIYIVRVISEQGSAEAKLRIR